MSNVTEKKPGAKKPEVSKLTRIFVHNYQTFAEAKQAGDSALLSPDANKIKTAVKKKIIARNNGTFDLVFWCLTKQAKHAEVAEVKEDVKRHKRDDLHDRTSKERKLTPYKPTRDGALY